MGYKEQLRKISKYEFELPKSGKMLVPGRIFISKKLLKDVEEEAINQIANVAQLKGIIGSSFGMADIHSGYGFSIGGVAAFDLEKGIISPGGVGYDINCLTGDSKILTEFGQSIQIKEFESANTEIEINNQKLLHCFLQTKLQTLNLKSKQQENKSINFLMKKTSSEVHEIELTSGIKIKATKEHPFLTKKGMKELSFLNQNEELAVNMFKGVEASKEISERTGIITKLLGYMFGDGCLYKTNNKYRGTAYGSKQDLEEIKNDLERIKINSTIISRNRDHKIKTKYGLVEFNTTNHELHIYSQEFLKELESLGMPLGNKTRTKVNVPKWIMNSNKIIKRLFLAGFFGAELSSPKASSKTCFFCPTVDQNKIGKLRQNMRDFLIDLALLLEEFSITNTKISEFDDFENRYREKTKRFRLFVKGEEDILKLWQTIGFEYNEKRRNLANIASMYILLKKQENAKRQQIAKKVKEYKKKGFTVKEIQKIFSKDINSRFIERHYYENAGQRINLDFISFNDFLEKKLEELKKHGSIFDKIKSIKKIPGEQEVFDFNIKDNHNFIANNFIVSNCGVRVLATDITIQQLAKKTKEILHDLNRAIPSGVGRGHKEKLSKQELDEILKLGAEWAVKNKMGTEQDLEHCEENGKIKNANPTDVSQRAKARGLPQSGTLGAGNHFIEIQKIEQIFDEKIAETFGLKKDNIVIMIHCGSRGLGHQVASDYIKAMEQEYGFANLPDRELINAPINSDLGKKYISAMNCAVNFAFCNRQIIMHYTRQVLKRHFPKSKNHLVYDVAHNIAKFEEHQVNGKTQILCVHRKGATRSFGPGRKEIPEIYRQTGQPVIIPGSMGTSSYILVGTTKAEELSWGSTAHGAGRVMSRSQAFKTIKPEQVKQELDKKGILLESHSIAGIVTEAPQVYKDIDEVIKVSSEVGLAKPVARLIPLGVIKG